MKPIVAIHPKTENAAALLIRKPVSPVLIVGPSGSGKADLAKHIAHEILANIMDLYKYPYFMHVKKTGNKQEISIDTVRDITGFIKLKVPGGGLRRIVFIENAQHLSIEAQNALLKILEEPHDDTIFILTAAYELSLLPTIVSRCQKIKVYPITLKQASDFYGRRFNERSLQSAWHLSQGRSRLLDGLLNDDDSHPLKQAVEKAKDFLNKPRAERLIMLDRLSREDNMLFLEALSRVLAVLYNSAQQRKASMAKRLLSDRKTVQKIIKAHERNGNQRLANLELLTQLSI